MKKKNSTHFSLSIEMKYNTTFMYGTYTYMYNYDIKYHADLFITVKYGNFP